MIDRPQESDWKRFRAIVPELRERYLARLNPELIALLGDQSSTPTERFWAASERMDEIGKILKSCLDGHSRSSMVRYMMLMYRHQMLTDKDMEGFSDEVREMIGRLGKIC